MFILKESYSFTTIGRQNWTVPKSGFYRIEAWGARGGDTASRANGGLGGYFSGVLFLLQSEVITVGVGGMGQTSNTTGATPQGGAGLDRGGNGSAGYSGIHRSGGGGGSSGIIRAGERILVAGGGGGAGFGHNTGYGGKGGGHNGQSTQGSNGGKFGEQLFAGGNGSTHTGRGGGGAGYGRGVAATSDSLGGSGGSGYWDDSLFLDIKYSSGVRNGNGQVIITYCKIGFSVIQDAGYNHLIYENGEWIPLKEFSGIRENFLDYGMYDISALTVPVTKMINKMSYKLRLSNGEIRYLLINTSELNNKISDIQYR